MTFFNGQIEKIELVATVLNQKVRFVNDHSIGISSEEDVRNLEKISLQSLEKYTYIVKDNGEEILQSGGDARNSESADYLYVNVADVISYDPKKLINANDISPEPTEVRLNDKSKSFSLYKPETTKLFEGVVYSDAIGLFNEDNPNGLVQIEADVRFLMNTGRKRIKNHDKRWPYYMFFPPLIYSEGYGYFGYIDLKARLSKIEENNRVLEPSPLNNELVFNPLDVFQHQTYSLGLDLNLLNFENQNKKINTYIDAGIRWGQSQLRVNAEPEAFNTLEASGLVKFELVPEKRYAFSITNRISFYEIFNDDELTLGFVEEGNKDDVNDFINTTSLQFLINAGNTGRIFLRYNLMASLKDFDNNFSQLQFSYSFFILKRLAGKN